MREGLPLKVIQSPVSLTTQERRPAYRHKRNTRVKSPPFKCRPPVVEPQYINSYSPFLTDCESDFTDNSFLTSSKEGGVMGFKGSIDSVVATDYGFQMILILIIMVLLILIIFLLLRNPGLQPQSYQ